MPENRPFTRFIFYHTATTEIYTLSLHDALPISPAWRPGVAPHGGHVASTASAPTRSRRSEEHTSELQSRPHLVCRLLLEKKKYQTIISRSQSFMERQRVTVLATLEIALALGTLT